MKSLYFFVLLAFQTVAQSTLPSSKEAVRNGILDLRSESALHSIHLDGLWQFTPNQLLPPGRKSEVANFIAVPSWWVSERQSPPTTHGTYDLLVLLPKANQQRQLAIAMPGVYSSYTLWVNDELLGANGIVSADAEHEVPQWKPATYSFLPTSDSLHVRIQLSNHSHFRSGIGETIYLGDAASMLAEETDRQLYSSILFFALILFALAAIVRYFVGSVQDKAIFYYALLCISWATRSVFSNHYLVTQWWPEIPWDVCMRVEYITIYVTTLFGSLLVGRLFPQDVNRVARVLFVIICSVFTLFTLFTPPLLFTRYVQLYLGISSILLLSMLIIIIRAYVANRRGLSYLLGCLLLAIVMFAYVILAYEGVFELNEFLFNGGFVLLFMASGLATFYRLKKMAAGDEDMLTFDQFK